jgi:hypothetical protein
MAAYASSTVWSFPHYLSGILEALPSSLWLFFSIRFGDLHRLYRKVLQVIRLIIVPDGSVWDQKFVIMGEQKQLPSGRIILP